MSTQAAEIVAVRAAGSGAADAGIPAAAERWEGPAGPPGRHAEATPGGSSTSASGDSRGVGEGRYVLRRFSSLPAVLRQAYVTTMRLDRARAAQRAGSRSRRSLTARPRASTTSAVSFRLRRGVPPTDYGGLRRQAKQSAQAWLITSVSHRRTLRPGIHRVYQCNRRSANRRHGGTWRGREAGTVRCLRPPSGPALRRLTTP